MSMRNPILAVLAVLVVGGIVLNPAWFASAAERSCAAPPPTLGRYEPSAAGRVMPDAPFVDAEGRDQPLASLRGQGLVVNFWATWCAPCVEEMPALDRLAAKSGPLGLKVVVLSADREGARVVRDFYRVNNIANLAADLDRSGRVARSLGIAALPTTVLYDADGRERGRVVGRAKWDAPAVAEFLAACLAPGT